MKAFEKKIILLFVISICIAYTSSAQLQITQQSNALALVQKLVGTGVVVSNVTLSGGNQATGFFNNILCFLAFGEIAFTTNSPL